MDVRRVRHDGRRTPHVLTLLLLTLLLVMGVLAACGGDDKEGAAGESATTTTASEATTTTPPEDEDEATTTEPTTGTTAAVVEDPWQAHAVALRAEPIGSRHEFECPPPGEADTVWGTDIYTDDSSVCTAAVHAGFITFDDGGTVTIELQGPQESYEASTRNGVTTFEYPAWEGSFSVESAD